MMCWGKSFMGHRQRLSHLQNWHTSTGWIPRWFIARTMLWSHSLNLSRHTRSSIYNPLFLKRDWTRSSGTQEAKHSPTISSSTTVTQPNSWESNFNLVVRIGSMLPLSVGCLLCWNICGKDCCKRYKKMKTFYNKHNESDFSLHDIHSSTTRSSQTQSSNSLTMSSSITRPTSKQCSIPKSSMPRQRMNTFKYWLSILIACCSITSTRSVRKLCPHVASCYKWNFNIQANSAVEQNISHLTVHNLS